MSQNLVKVSQGTLKGKIVTTDKGFAYHSYQGIPYAKPPIGDLRFKNPEPPEEWSGILDTTKERSINLQIDWIFINPSLRECTGSEDSLYLNVYAPKSDVANPKFPVMFWVHGGGFMVGSGNSDFYGPDYLIEHNVILITFNYRLGPLGFLCTHTDDAPGNAGLKDQVMALKWVNENIEKFGGDPNNITIFGESAGSAAVQYLILSKMTKGLFHKAICQSGSCINPWALQTNPENKALLLAKYLGMESANKDEATKFLKSVSCETLINGAYSMADGKVALFFLPVIETTDASCESFINKCPVELLNTGEFNKLPTITGFTSKEGMIWYYKEFQYEKKQALSENVLPDFRLFLAPTDKELLGPEKSVEAALKIKEFYFPNINGSHKYDLFEGYVDLMSDFAFTLQIDHSAKMFSKYSPSSYYYKFSYSGSLNVMKYLCDHEYAEAGHTDELGYLFKNTTFPKNVQTSSEDVNMIKTITELWTNFAKSGDPTPRLTKNITTIWKPVTETDVNCLEINTQLRVIKDPFVEKSKFWDNLTK